jgi:hypothetical protein
MLGLKKKARAEDVALALLTIANGSEESNAGWIRYLKELDVKLNEGRVLDELKCLRVFVVELAVLATLRDPSRQRVFDAYRAPFEKMGSLDPESHSALAGLATRVVQYRKAAAMPHHIGPAWTVGCAFAEFCGAKEDIRIVGMAGIEFKLIYKLTTEYLSNFKIV